MRPFIEPVNSGVSFVARVVRRHPVVGGARVVLVRRADEGEVLGARDVVRGAAMQIAARQLLLVQLDQLAGREALRDQPIALGLRPVADTRPPTASSGPRFRSPSYERPDSLPQSYRRRFCVVKSSIIRLQVRRQLRVADAVRRPGIHHHLERLARLLQLVGELHGVLRMDVVVERAVNQQQLAR